MFPLQAVVAPNVECKTGEIFHDVIKDDSLNQDTLQIFVVVYIKF